MSDKEIIIRTHSYIPNPQIYASFEGFAILNEIFESYQKYKIMYDAVKRMREAALVEQNWYTFLPCEYAEDVDKALEGLDKE